MMHDLQPTVSWNPRTLGWLGDDTSTLAARGFDSSEISQIMNAHDACALSPQGYAYLLTGGVDPAGLADFLTNDPGCQPGEAPPGGGRLAVPNVNVTLAPGPSPMVEQPGFFGWLAQPSFFGVSNGAMLSLGVLGLTMFSGGRLTSGYTVTRRKRRR